MWRSRPKSTSREIDNSNTNNNNINSSSIRRSSSPNLNFIHSSLKDVVNLFSDDVTKTIAQPSPSPSPTTATRRLSIFHRVHLANKFARAFSTNLTPKSPKSQSDSIDTSTDYRVIKSSISTQSNRQISIPGPEKPSPDIKLTKSLNSTQSNRQISISGPEKPTADNKLIKSSISTRSNRQISILEAENIAADNKLTRSFNSTQSDRQISIPEAEKAASDTKLAKYFNSTQSDRQILIPEAEKAAADTKLTKYFNSTKFDRQITIPGAENRVILYTTSLRVVRKTFEACRTVKSIIRAFRVSIDERDLSMDSNFVKELHSIMNQVGEDVNERNLELPMVFIGGRYIGGAEEVKELHETGELKKFLERLPRITGGVCEVCGDYRFVVCDECSGSRKCYSEKGGFRCCVLCNENGLVRCPLCLG